MIHLREQFNLTNYNTFGVKATAAQFFEFTESEELFQYFDGRNLPEKYFVLGGGSNLLFTEDYDGLILHPNIPGIYEVREDRNFAYLEAGAGVEWDKLVKFAVDYDLAGLENLSLIPGSVGAAPVQNIGAYGVEVKDRIELVRAIDLGKMSRVEFTAEECGFGYRDSIFKKERRNKVLVTSVVFRLDKYPEFNLDYGALRIEAERLGEISLQNVRQAVITIRESKLPDPKVLGNAGSFFKNPIVRKEQALELAKQFENMPQYPTGQDGTVKLAAGWLIDQCGLKGFRKGNVGVHQKQALVLVNYGGARGKDLEVLASKVQAEVNKKFGIELEPEVTHVK